jgi:hypothetical protein
MSLEKYDDLLASVLEQNFLLAEKVSALTNQVTLLQEVIRWQDGLDKHWIGQGHQGPGPRRKGIGKREIKGIANFRRGRA